MTSTNPDDKKALLARLPLEADTVDSLCDEITELKLRINLAEECMRHTWVNRIVPNGTDIVYPLEKYREKYPKVIK